jgi:hypothetical protein
MNSVDLRSYSPIWKRIFDVVQRRVHKYTAVVPCTGFDPDRFMDEAALGHVLVGNSDCYDATSKVDVTYIRSSGRTVLAQ